MWLSIDNMHKKNKKCYRDLDIFYHISWKKITKKKFYIGTYRIENWKYTNGFILIKDYWSLRINNTTRRNVS